MTPKLLAITAKVVGGLLLTVIVGALVVLTVVPRAVGGAALTVLTGSMSPTIAAGAVVVVQPVDPGTLEIGDVITYQVAPGEDAFITHRITGIDSSTDPVTFTTKGDANRGGDTEPVPATAVRGRVLFDVPYLGTIRNSISLGGSGPVLLVLALGGYAVAQVVSARRDRRRARSSEGEDATPAAHEAPAAERAVQPAETGVARSDTAELLAERPAAPGPQAAGLPLQMVALTLPISAFPGWVPARVCRHLRVQLQHQDPLTFTCSLVGDPERVGLLLELLQPFGPMAVVRSEVVRLPDRSAVGDERGGDRVLAA